MQALPRWAAWPPSRNSPWATTGSRGLHWRILRRWRPGDFGASEYAPGDEGLRHLAKLVRLKSLNLEGTDVSDAGLAHLAGLKDLQSLSLTNTAIGNKGLESLRPLANLKHIDLIHTMVNDAGLTSLKAHTNLEDLDLDDTGVGDTGIEQLQDLAHLKASVWATRGSRAPGWPP